MVPKLRTMEQQVRFITPKESREKQGSNPSGVWAAKRVGASLHKHVSSFQDTYNRTRNLEVTGCEGTALALAAEAHTDVHLELAVYNNHEFIHDVPELQLQDGATREHQDSRLKTKMILQKRQRNSRPFELLRLRGP